MTRRPGKIAVPRRGNVMHDGHKPRGVTRPVARGGDLRYATDGKGGRR